MMAHQSIAKAGQISVRLGCRLGHRSLASIVCFVERVTKHGPSLDLEREIPQPTEASGDKEPCVEGNWSLRTEESKTAAKQGLKMSRRLRRHWERMDRDMQDLSVYDPRPGFDMDHADSVSGMMEGPDWYLE